MELGRTDDLQGPRERRRLLTMTADPAATPTEPSEEPFADDIVVYTSPAGAAHLMKEIVELGAFDAALEEDEGHWRVVVRAGVPGKPVTSGVLRLVAHTIDERELDHATVCVGRRSFTLYPTLAASSSREPHPPAAAA
jgi:hypothetical protein